MNSSTVLIVDDDPMIRDALAEILSSVGGYKTEVAVNGSDGISKIKERRYDMIFTDLTMPQVNGIDLLKETRKIDADIPVVVITGFSTIENAVAAMKEGAYDFITKPFKIDKVISLAKRIEGEKRQLEDIVDKEDQKASIAKLNSELFCKLQEISVFQSLSTELDGFYNNKDIYERLVGMVTRLFSVKEASFGILENGGLKVKGAIGTRQKDMSVAGSIFENVLRRGTYYVAKSGEINPHTEMTIKSSFLSIPLTINNEVFGMLNLAEKDDGAAFSQDEIYLAINFAKKAALRIENNALYDVLYNNLVSALKSLVMIIEARDPYTRHHSERVTQYSLEIAEIMALSEDDKEAIRFGGYLHDIGKIGVRDTVLLKPDRLTDEEIQEIRLHPVIGDNIMKPLNFFSKEKPLIRNHHERFDGRGYPDGLEGEEIPMIVRIIAVADAYDAMTSSRPYRKARSHEFATEEMVRCSNSQFDPEVVKAFLNTPALKSKGIWVLN
ncbi:MAG TPA: HD domain-containing phosphohydrolase [Thermodesulfovibrionales bacterium]|nr:HD domain-containing phosphohydrolase [Thermodesulfovibrionales bacterium]